MLLRAQRLYLVVSKLDCLASINSNPNNTDKVRSLVKESPFWQVFGTWFVFKAVLARHEGDNREAEDSWTRFGQSDDVFIFIATRRPESLEWAIPVLDTHLMSGYGPTPPALDDTFESLLMLGIAEDI